ncbi:glycosyltransferase family A protein [Acidilobus saccharovorans]|uniref:glycosyltransferase family A protein n=1 Tax=Acidilobus saccharovorans TaxID=242703 RepID=UPI000662133C|nr:glycosyltransferase family A protein [Acidilobus saccharovorans]
MQVSVIVTAHDRRRYLPHALRSLEMQTLPRDRFEVIVVKNFEDKESDEIIRRNGWKNVVTDVVPLGGKIAIGLEEAKGDIITFLEDDDMYREVRLEKVYKVFTLHRDVIYFHNEQVLIDERGDVISDESLFPAVRDRGDYVIRSSLLSKVERKMGVCYYQLLPLLKAFGPGLGLNNSSIAVRRGVVSADKLKDIEITVDIELFASALKYKGEASTLYFTGKPLTYFRVHEDNASSIAFNTAFGKAALLNQLNNEAYLVNRVKWLLKLARWHGFVSKELPQECVCNAYGFSSTIARLEAIYLPMPLARTLSQSLTPPASELIKIAKCAVTNFALSSSKESVKILGTLRFLAFLLMPYVLVLVDRAFPHNSGVPLYVRRALSFLRSR